jgi:uncharacterized protein YjdB
MPASSSFQVRAQSDVQTSTLLASATDSIGSRAQGFAARTGPSTVVGGDFTVDSIVLSPAALMLLKDQTSQLTAQALDAEGELLSDQPDTWASSDETVATVSASGLVTVVGAGSCTVTGAIGAVTSNDCTITVTAIFSALTLTPDTLAFAHTTTGTTTLTAQDQFGVDMALPSGATPLSSDTNKATVGLVTDTITVTGVASGTANVTASKSGITSNACVVTLS